MNNLTHSEYQKILKAVEILNSDVDPKSLPKRMLHSVNYAVSSDITAFEMCNQVGEYQGVLIYEPMNAISPQELEIYGNYMHEHPIYGEIIFNRRFNAIAISDFVPDNKFTRTGIYNEYYRRVGIDRQISVTMDINPDCLVVCTLSRDGRDFDEIEKAVLNLMSPHFTSAVRNTNSFERLQSSEENWQSVAESMGRAIIILDSEMIIKYLSDYSAQLLEKYFPKDKLKINNFPHFFYRWIAKSLEETNKTKEFRLPPKPLTLTANGERLLVQFTYNTSSNLINLFLSEEKDLSVEDLTFLGLTKRETEILYWIACGKSNPEIAILCNISVRTVHKHVEHIYIKLGIETRTAAILRVKEIIQ
ncbi:MAG: helix-turn-helix transcriptional regulator [Pyrinomonadaceae bacterium]|nr:helix-turn-helix transcriptional regulator [Pyrinomonadaceae bacterium]